MCDLKSEKQTSVFVRYECRHMARLWHASRLFGIFYTIFFVNKNDRGCFQGLGGYSLEGLTRDLLQRGKVTLMRSSRSVFACEICDALSISIYLIRLFGWFDDDDDDGDGR